MDVLEKLNKDLYKEEQFYILGIGLLLAGFILGGVVLSVLFGLAYGVSPLIFSAVRNINARELFNTEIIPEAESVSSGVSFGKDELGKPLSLPVEILNHVFIIGMTRFGKTRLAYALICSLIENYEPEELKFAFSDAKAVSFNIFSHSKHLFAPIAKSEEETSNLIELLLEEMYKRQDLFGQFGDRKICTNVDEYYHITGEKLPRIVVFFDELADSVEKGSIAERNLTTLAKMGLASGINLVLITQRPTKEGVTHEVTSQAVTILSTYMKNSTEYGSVAKIPKAIYGQMIDRLKDGGGKGLFMMFNPDLAPYFIGINEEYEGWGFVQSRYLENELVEKIAAVDYADNLNLPSLASTLPAWSGGEEEKMDAMEALDIKLGYIDVDSMVKHFGISKRTAAVWLDKYNENN